MATWAIQAMHCYAFAPRSRFKPSTLCRSEDGIGADGTADGISADGIAYHISNDRKIIEMVLVL